jgi:hypothetical protein
MIAAVSPKPKRKSNKKKTSKRKKATAPPWSHEGFGQHVKPQQSYFDDEVEGYGDFPPQTKEPYWWQGRAGSEWRGIDDKPKTRSRSRSRKKDKVEMAADALSLGSQISSALKKK